MTTKEIQKNIEVTTGKSLLSVAEVARWSGRSRDFVSQTLLRNVDSIQTGRERLFFSGDIARAITARASGRKTERR